MNTTILSWNDEKTVKKLQSVLEKDELFLGSTDTILGFYAQVSEKSFEKLNELKGRQNKPYLILVSDSKKILKYVDASLLLQAEKIMDRFWPGPLTIIFKAKEEVSEFIKGKEGTIAFRIPDHKGAQKLLKEVPVMFSTSANKTGQPFPKTIEEVDQDIENQIDICVIDDENQSEGAPSTIIQVDESGITGIREGAITFSEIVD